MKLTIVLTNDEGVDYLWTVDAEWFQDRLDPVYDLAELIEDTLPVVK